MFGQAIAELETATNLSRRSPLMLAALGHTYAASGKRDAAHTVLDELKELSERRYVSPDDIAILYMGLQAKEQALAWLERAYQERSAWMVMAKVEPRFDALRDEPRLHELIRGVGLSA